jgi:hypothetical protein
MIPLPKSPAAATAILVVLIGVPTIAIAAWNPHPAAHAAPPSQSAAAVAQDTAQADAHRAPTRAVARPTSNLQH